MNHAVGKKDDDGNAHLYDASCGWVNVANCVIDDYLFGFDPTEELSDDKEYGVVSIEGV